MRADKIKGRNPELVQDWNGHPIQIFTLGGETISVSNSSFSAKSCVIRVHNPSAAKSVLKLSTLESGDLGTSIGAGQTETFGCLVGDIFAVTGTVEVTFIRDRG